MKKEVFKTNKAPAAVGPYSQAAKAGQLLFLSGQGPLDPKTNKLIVGDVKRQTTQVLQNIKTILEEAGTSMGDVLKCTVFLSDMDNYSEMNEVYATFFPRRPPARTTVQARLPFDILVEIDAIALLPS